MRIQKLDVRKNNTSCNFCDKGELSDNKYAPGLVYPYKTVYSFIRDSGNGLSATICEGCLEELFFKTGLTDKSIQQGADSGQLQQHNVMESVCPKCNAKTVTIRDTIYCEDECGWTGQTAP